LLPEAASWPLARDLARAGILQAAASARNGWKVILERCAPMRRPRSALAQPKARPSSEGAEQGS